MSKSVEIEISSREIIKPSETSPNHPEIHTLSIFYQYPPLVNVPLVYFYTNETDQNINVHPSSKLKTSLSTILSRFYPLAGRIRDDVSIDCNDEGAVFVEAPIRCKLSEFLQDRTEETIQVLLPHPELKHKDVKLISPLVVQVTVFECGGIAIAACVLHKIMDMVGMTSLINNWAALTRDSIKVMTPGFDLWTLYPPIELPIDRVGFIARQCVSKKLVLSASKMAKLKSLVAHRIPNPTRVELATALICKHQIKAIRTNSGVSKPIALFQTVNLRSRVFQSLPQADAGNFVAVLKVEINPDTELNLCSFVREIRQQKEEYFNALRTASSAQKLLSIVLQRVEKLMELPSKGDCSDMFFFSSWCRFQVYEADFGWGKPAWFTTYGEHLGMENGVVLMDTREGDGVEAHVTMEKQDMAVFQSDEELLAFATFNGASVQ